MLNKYPEGNIELFNMLKSNDFDVDYAKVLLDEIGDVNAPIVDLNGFSTTYLYEAQENNNYEAVKLLLQNGADPNFYDPDLSGDCALWNLQYSDFDSNGNEGGIRYEIAKLFFAFGANPNIVIDEERLYDYVMYKVFNEIGVEKDYEYLLDFYKLLVVYGGGMDGSGYGKPRLIETLNPEIVDDYTIKFFKCEDNYHITASLFDSNGKEVCRL